MNASEAHDMMKVHGYLRRIHFGETSLTDTTNTNCQTSKIPIGIGAVEFKRDKQGDFVTKNLFAVILLDRVFFSPEKNSFYALATTTMPMIPQAFPLSNSIQTWAALAPKVLSEILDQQAGTRPKNDSEPTRRGPVSSLINRLMHHKL